ncbi:hypothetical protein KC957_02815 [Candidatus Saccharibacteria bacterium]|nr:hypothetical protein [Candidatus Saccharibacteria bacterium]
MKQKDVALIIIVVFVSAIASFFLSGVLFKTNNLTEKVETVEAISADFPTPDKKFFNGQSINPTQLIRIGQDQNKQPFNE